MRQPVRKDALATLQAGSADFDLIVVGGGITGAGIAREAATSGLRTLLVEQKDFAWGTSSRSSKMVHGGLRYLGSGQISLTRDAVRERQRLLKEAPGLVQPLQFLMPHYRRQFPGPRLFGLLLAIYDMLAGRRSRKHLTPGETLNWIPGLRSQHLKGASGFTDAVTDDARLVQRIIEEARAAGAWCLNYVTARRCVADSQGNQTLSLHDTAEPDGASFNVTAPVIVNAAGAWATTWNSPTNPDPGHSIRPLRGSHVVLPYSTLPVDCSVSLLHPDDRRPVFAFPWHGMTVLGTTDLDHADTLDLEPRITGPELEYLLKIAATLFPGHEITASDVIATWAGVRPVVTEGTAKAPSKENREHVIWDSPGMINVAGGKLTTYRLIAREVLSRCSDRLPQLALRHNDEPGFTPPPLIDRPAAITHADWTRFKGSYGTALPEVLSAGPLVTVCGTQHYWCEVIWAAGHADVIHLDDLMLRRTRLGLVLPDGGSAVLDDIQRHCQPVLPWDNDTWIKERGRYLELWKQHYSLPEASNDAG